MSSAQKIWVLGKPVEIVKQFQIYPECDSLDCISSSIVCIIPICYGEKVSEQIHRQNIYPRKSRQLVVKPKKTLSYVYVWMSLNWWCGSNGSFLRRYLEITLCFNYAATIFWPTSVYMQKILKYWSAGTWISIYHNFKSAPICNKEFHISG